MVWEVSCVLTLPPPMCVLTLFRTCAPQAMHVRCLLWKESQAVQHCKLSNVPPLAPHSGWATATYNHPPQLSHLCLRGCVGSAAAAYAHTIRSCVPSMLDWARQHTIAAVTAPFLNAKQCTVTHLCPSHTDTRLHTTTQLQEAAEVEAEEDRVEVEEAARRAW